MMMARNVDPILVSIDTNSPNMVLVNCVQITQEFRMMENLAFPNAVIRKRSSRVVSVNGAGNQRQLQKMECHVSNQNVDNKKN